MNILLLEDRGSIAVTLKELLEFKGYTVYEAYNPADADALLQDEGLVIHGIILDLNLPVDGLSSKEIEETDSGLFTGLVWLKNHVLPSAPDMLARTCVYSGYVPDMRKRFPNFRVHCIGKREGNSSPIEALLAFLEGLRTNPAPPLPTGGGTRTEYVRERPSDISDQILRYVAHELSQQCDGLDSIRVRYMTDPSKLRNITDKNAEDLNLNMEAYLKQLRTILEIARMLPRREPLVANKTSFWPYGEIIGKWLDAFYIQRERKRMSLHYTRPSGHDDPFRPRIWADANLYEMLLYNLINNAEKYGYRGTRIHLDFKLESEDGVSPKPSASYVLAVTDYGARPEGGERMFEAFTRTNASGGGLGVGLYLARKIMEAHGGTIDFEPSDGVKISDYNVALLGPAVRMGETVFKDKEYRAQLEAELRRLENTGIYDQVASGNYQPFKLAIRTEINKPTYKVSIVARFPHEGSW